MTSSIQSVSTHPVASPDSMPRHHGLLPSATILSDSAVSWSHVVGTSYLLAVNDFGEYQTSDLRFEPSGAPKYTPSTVPKPTQVLAQLAVASLVRASVAGLSVPPLANFCSRPGCGKYARSGALPPETLVFS